MRGQTLRLRYAKRGKVRWTSHRDAARIWERGLRRAGLALAYTEGFAPRPRLHFGLALPTGYESDAELLDVDLDAAALPVDAMTVPGRLASALPEGFTVTAAAVLSGDEPSLQQDVTSCSWTIELRDLPPAVVESAVRASCWLHACLTWLTLSASPIGWCAPTNGSNVTAPAGNRSRCRRRPTRTLSERAHDKEDPP